MGYYFCKINWKISRIGCNILCILNPSDRIKMSIEMIKNKIPCSEKNEKSVLIYLVRFVL